jgi:heme-degrading monooxygenase HmoA
LSARAVPDRAPGKIRHRFRFKGGAMTVVFQAAGKLRPKTAQEIKRLFAEARPLLEAQPGFVRARLLASYSTLQVQILTYWESYEAGAAFQRGAYAQLARAIAPAVEPRGTLITSMLERGIEPASA